ncbi:MAG TPA: TerB family tellurite resistance protein [Mariprofundaceae bacterium]|nr:TerB family tellurite resistance protein [Mariprofundaceae bacterium]
MIDRLKKLLHPMKDKAVDPERQLALAVAALLVEVMRMDGRIEESERLTIVAALKHRFHLSETESDTLIAEASQETEQSHDLHRFTSKITGNFSTAERIDIVRELWLVAMADGKVDPYEEQLIRRTAELIGIYHHEFIQAKLAAHQKLEKS